MRIQDARYELASREEVRALQLQTLQALLRQTRATNPFYRAHWAAAGVDIERITSLEAFAALVPTVQKADFVRDQEDDPPYGRRHAHALGLGEPLYVAMTSGTSGQGQELHLQTAAEVAVTGQVYAYLFRWAGLTQGDRVFLCMPVTLLAGGRLEFEGGIAYGLTMFPVGNYSAERKVELLRRFAPQAVVANSSYLGRLATHLADAPPPVGLKCLITGGEGSGIEWLQRLQETWGAPAYDRYGSTQSGNDHMFTCDRGIGDAHRPGMLHNIDPLVLLEVIDPATGRQVASGEEGELVITSLYHRDTPLIRCRIGDRAVYREGRSCGCGRQFIGVETASIARTDDMKKVKGVNVWPQAVDDVLFASSEVEEYQVILGTSADGGDTATLRVMPKAALAAEAGAALADRIAARLRQRIGFRFEVELLPPHGLDVNEWKARRWLDQRAHARRPASVGAGNSDDARAPGPPRP